MAEQVPSTPTQKPSLFLACRLASIVQKFSHRLQEKVQQRKRASNPLGTAYRRDLRLRALSNLEKVALPRRLSINDEPRSALDHQDHGRWINGLLADFDTRTTSSNDHVSALTKVAADDRLLFSASQNTLVEAYATRVDLPHAAHLFDSCCLLIHKLEAIQSDNSTAARLWDEYDADCKRLKDEKFIANLLHLLRRLQYLIFQILVHKSLRRLDECAANWHEFWQQRKKIDDDWFTEWPSGERPLSTTWPWNIRPSLVVLWGVCWMFYPGDQGDCQDYPYGVPHRHTPGIDSFIPVGYWEPNPATDETFGDGSFRHQGSSIARPDHLHVDDSSSGMAQSGGVGAVRARPQRLSGDPTAPQASAGGFTNMHRIHNVHDVAGHIFMNLSVATEPSFCTSQALSAPPSAFESRDYQWPGSPGAESRTNAIVDPSHALPWSGPYNSQVSQGYSISVSAVPELQVPPQETTQYYLPSNAPASLNRLNEFSQEELDAMGSFEEYPSPSSDRGTAAHSVSPILPTKLSPNMSNHQGTSPSSEGSVVGKQRISKGRGEPPRNGKDQIYCNHVLCSRDPPTFRRPCEWNKHMDKHDRPYRCDDPACAKVQGFTYSGGLLRHQREVHKKNAVHSQPLFCPHSSCNRHSGNGFTRQENLREHIRRRHVGETDVDTQPSPETTTIPIMQTAILESTTEPSRKRKRIMDSATAADEDDVNVDNDDLRREIKRLHTEAEERERRVQELEDYVRLLKQQLQNQNPRSYNDGNR